MKPIAIIPARGGSKRLPRKNIRVLLGRPLLQWPVQAALDSGLFERVVVSTEDPEISEIAREAGAEVLVRPDSIATDTSTVVDVCMHALDTYSETEDFCCIYATAALLTVKDLLDSHEMYMQQTFDSVMAVAEYDLSPFSALHEVDGKWRMVWPEFGELQSQKRPSVLACAGMLFWMDVQAMRQYRTFYTDNMGVYRVPRSRLCDVDTIEDFVLVEKAAKELYRDMS